MGELILHIGVPKTGTTSLQGFFDLNRDALRKHGVDYVKFTAQQSELFQVSRNGCFLTRYCRARTSHEELSDQVSDLEENCKRLADALGRDQRVLLSDENFYGFSSCPFKGDYTPEMYWQQLDRVVSKMGASSILIVIYLRRQDELAVSQWKERVKNGYFTGSIQEFLARPDTKKRLAFINVLDAIRSVMKTPTQISVRSYEQAVKTGAGIFHDFCEAAGIEWDSGFVLPRRRNESISFDMARALQKCSYGGRKHSKDEKRRRSQLASALSRLHPDPKGTGILSVHEREKIMEEYADVNRRIEEQYFSGSKLFSEEIKDGPMWRPNILRIIQYRLAFACPGLSERILQRLDRNEK